jgi:hypothetical protein
MSEKGQKNSKMNEQSSADPDVVIDGKKDLKKAGKSKSKAKGSTFSSSSKRGRVSQRPSDVTVQAGSVGKEASQEVLSKKSENLVEVSGLGQADGGNIVVSKTEPSQTGSEKDVDKAILTLGKENLDSVTPILTSTSPVEINSGISGKEVQAGAEDFQGRKGFG